MIHVNLKSQCRFCVFHNKRATILLTDFNTVNLCATVYAVKALALSTSSRTYEVFFILKLAQDLYRDHLTLKYK